MDAKIELFQKLQQDILLWQGGRPLAARKAERIGLGEIEGSFPSEHVVQDYATVGLSLKAHPVSFVRSQLEMLNIRSCHTINNDSTDGQLVKVAGLVLVHQRPGTAGGVCFITMEDETGYSNLVVFEKLFDTCRKEI